MQLLVFWGKVFGLPLATSLVLSGCVGVPAGSQPAENFPENTYIESLIGSTKQLIQTKPGEPQHILTGKDKSQFIYQGRGDEFWVGFLFYIHRPPVGERPLTDFQLSANCHECFREKEGLTRMS
jgi:hypothetical protein